MFWSCFAGVEKNAGSDDGDEMASYMDQMDWELARTSLGQSFEKVSSNASTDVFTCE